MADAATATRSAVLGVHSSAMLETVPPCVRFSLRAPATSVDAVSKALGVTLPVKPKTSAEKGGVHALWLGPDEWFLIAPAGTDLAGRLAKADAFHSAVDISHRNAAILVRGAGAADILNAGCPQDLSLPAFPVGACSRTVLAKTEVILYRLAADAFRIEVWRSFAPYAHDFLEDAVRRAV